MDLLVRLLTPFAGPKLGKWFAGLAAAGGGLLALFVARQRGEARGRAQVRAENARELARKQAELNDIRSRQMKAASNRPDTGELDEILKKGKF